MVKPSKLLGLGAAVGLLLASAEAFASDSLNPSLGRLVVDHRCQQFEDVSGRSSGSFDDFVANIGAGNPVGKFNTDPAQRSAYAAATGRDTCYPDHVAFKRLMNQWGFALAPTAMHSARTTGFGGFHFSMEAVYTKINGGADYWKLGSQGGRDPSTSGASAYNKSPPGVIQQYSVRARKSFGFGLELGTTVGFVPSSTILTGGADARMALLEGFRTGFLGILPDVAVGAGVRTITGTPEMQLTTVGLDVQLSKPLTIASQSVLTPWIGYQYVWIFADSGLIDTTPGTGATGYCNYAGQSSPGSPTAPGRTAFDGQPICAGGASPLDFNNNIVFDNARLERQRMMFGMNYRYEMVSFGAQFITDVIAPSDAQVGNGSSIMPRRTATGGHELVKVTDKDALKGEPRQWSLVLELGAAF